MVPKLKRLVAEIRYPYATLYLDHKGSFARSMLDYAPYIIQKSDPNKEIILRGEDENLRIRLAPEMSGVVISGKDSEDLFCSVCSELYSNTIEILKLDNKVNAFVVYTEHIMDVGEQSAPTNRFLPSPFPAIPRCELAVDTVKVVGAIDGQVISVSCKVNYRDLDDGGLGEQWVIVCNILFGDTDLKSSSVSDLITKALDSSDIIVRQLTTDQ